jgi:hypothetical protein
LLLNFVDEASNVTTSKTAGVVGVDVKAGSGTSGPRRATVTIWPRALSRFSPTGTAKIDALEAGVFTLGAVNVTDPLPAESVTTSPADNVPTSVVTTTRFCVIGAFVTPSRKLTRIVACELPSRATISGDAARVIERPKPDGPASGGAD